MAEPFHFTTPRSWPSEVLPEPEVLGAWIGACTDEERTEIARRWIEDAQAASRCFVMNHQAQEEELRWLRRRVIRLGCAWSSAARRARAYRETQRVRGFAG